MTIMSITGTYATLSHRIRSEDSLVWTLGSFNVVLQNIPLFVCGFTLDQYS